MSGEKHAVLSLGIAEPTLAGAGWGLRDKGLLTSMGHLSLGRGKNHIFFSLSFL